jgi:hypothetical protein
MKGRADTPSVPRVLGDHEDRIRILEFRPISRIACGVVAADGSTVNEGSGDWVITKDGGTSGVYLITFDPVFAVAPIVTATVTNDDVLGDGPFIATLDPTRDESSVTVRVWAVDTDPAPFDGQFDFVAIGA